MKLSKKLDNLMFTVCVIGAIYLIMKLGFMNDGYAVSKTSYEIPVVKLK